MVSRAQRTPFGEWWWTVDRFSLMAIGALLLAGVVLSLAASPPVAARLGLEPFYFVHRHIMFLLPSVALMLAMSFLNGQQIGETQLEARISEELKDQPAGQRMVRLKVHSTTEAFRFEPVLEAVSKAGGEIVHILEEKK